MKNVSLAYKFISKHMYANIFIIIELIFFSFVATILVNKANYYYENYNIYKNTPIESSIYYMGNPGVFNGEYSIIDDYQDKFFNELSKIDGIVGRSVIGEFLSERDGEYITVIFYDKLTADIVNPKVEGTWLSEISNVNQIITYNAESINEKVNVSVNIINSASSLMNQERKSNLIEGLEVVGVIKELPTSLVSTVVKTNEVKSIESLFVNSSSIKDSKVYFISSDHPAFADFQLIDDNFILYLDEVGLENESKITEVMAKYGYSTSGKKILENTKIAADDNFKYNVVTLAPIIVIISSSLISITFLNIKKFMKYLSIYIINGCSFFVSMIIYVYYLAFIAIAGFLGNYFIIFLMNMRNNNSNNLISDVELQTYKYVLHEQVLLFVVIIVFITLISFMPFYFVSKKSSINILKDS